MSSSTRTQAIALAESREYRRLMEDAYALECRGMPSGAVWKHMLDLRKTREIHRNGLPPRPPGLYSIPQDHFASYPG